ncbi:Exosome component 10, partial [Ascosphaera atra]
MDITSDPASFREQSLDALKGLTRVTNQLTAQDLAFHRSLDPTIGPAVDEQGTRILGLTSDLLRCASGKKAAPQLTDDDSVEDSWRNIVDVIDGLLEKADACLDEFTGLIKGAPENEREQRSGADAKPRFPSTYDRTSRIAKPQLQFEHAPDNQDTSPWKPLLRSKPHATVSLSESLEMRDGSYRNPYEREIKESKYPAFTYAVQEPKEFLPFDSTTATFVDSLDE